MNKEKWITIAIAIAVIIGIIVMIKYIPLWSTGLSVISFIIGVIGGIYGKIAYGKYVKVDKSNG